ncbi:MAG: hypothetical protein KA163_00745 [Bacteroidia bacterium]|nr:hypothetical protein [Bacteroidia bacterium]
MFKKLKAFFLNRNIVDLIFWTFDPIRLSAPEKLNSNLVIVHAVDHYLFTYPSEKILCKKADVVFCVSPEIVANFLKYAKNVHLIPHAIPSDEFLPSKSSVSKKPIALFAGTLDHRMDYEYLDYIIQKFPDVLFKFIGRINIKNNLINKLQNGSYPNVLLEGEKPFEEVKYHVQDATLCILFKDNRVSGNSISSHKMLQYLAQGKPVFCSELSQHEEIKDLLYMNNDKFKMEKLLRTFVEQGENELLVAKRISYAKRHSFETTLKKIEELLN